MELRIKDIKPYIVKGKKAEGVLRWVDGNQLQIKIDYTTERPSVRLAYTITSQNNIPFDYFINIIVRSSNLGKGQIFLFECPQTFRPCRTLHMKKGSPIFKSYHGYKGNNRLYYPTQTASKKWRANEQFFHTERKFNKLSEEPYKKFTYNGQETRKAKQFHNLLKKMEHYDNLRYYNLLRSISRLL